jgi:hypothetical protein
MSSMHNKVTDIDILTDMYSPGLYARKIWEALFRRVHAREWRSLDSFLCDLRIFEQLIKDRRDPVTFYWEYGNNGYTQVLDAPDIWSDGNKTFQITVDHPVILVEPVSC